MATAPPAYDDGSSTESEYYFDPAEEAEELAAYAWTHALDASASPSQPESDKVNAKITIKQEFSAASDESDEIALPQGSEWSHGAVYDDAVERALAMASRFEREMSNTQREEAMTADTMNGYEQEQEQEQVKAEPERKTLVRTLSSSGEVERKKVKVKSRIVSLKSVKATTPPASVTNSVVVGLRRPPTKLVGAPSELERGLSVARPQWRATSSQSSSSQKASPTFGKSLQAKKREKVMGVPVEKSSSSSQISIKTSSGGFKSD
ncbi:cAMP-dependent protein kinase type II regulatory subunit [Phytophthora cinnamomi]|uniref:cAMP-dependent protein kinase type II regulatory subunit n=1 Tax=Phytophthora cinnamomi TaxID=4785 RepID=UPI0035599EF2|nr:cAMP-dependent protein kinase type II regulatory subunit [Phytophthora cinnamomi]